MRRIRRAVYGDHSFRERRYGVVVDKDGRHLFVIETGRRGFERRMRRGTLNLEALTKMALEGEAK